MKRFVSSYGLAALIIGVTLFASSTLLSMKIYLSPVTSASATELDQAAEAEARQLYLLKSESTIRKMYSFGLSEAYYLERLDALKRRFCNNGYQVDFIDESHITRLPVNASLFAFDTMDMDSASLQAIKSFVRRGGSLLFNYHFAYHNGDRYRGDQAIREITGLIAARTTPHIRSKEALYLTSNVLSPLTSAIRPRGSKISIEIYDSLPLFTSASLEPDAIVTNWNVTSTLRLSGDDEGSKAISADESGVLWHGRYGKGKWIYTSLPSYSLYGSPDNPVQQEKLLIGLAEYSKQALTVQSYPYLDADKVVFVSEDTEFKFSSFAAFAELSNRYQVPVTAFLVAGLAEKHRDLLVAATEVPYIEFGSHSYTHKKIIGTGRENSLKETGGSKALVEAITGKTVKGFRPPREELDPELRQALKDSGYSYILEKRKDYLYPTIESGQEPLYTIPRSGTDDYLYMVNLNWDPDTILEKMIAETRLLSSVNGLYSMSIHTHLMAYKRNIDIVEKYFRFLAENPQLTAMSGGEIIDRVAAVRNVVYRIQSGKDSYRINISNQNPAQIKRLKFRAYWPAGRRLVSVRGVESRRVEYSHNERQGYTDVVIQGLEPADMVALVADFSE